MSSCPFPYLHDLPFLREIPYGILWDLSLFLIFLGILYFPIFGRTLSWTFRIFKEPDLGYAKFVTVGVTASGANFVLSFVLLNVVSIILGITGLFRSQFMSIFLLALFSLMTQFLVLFILLRQYLKIEKLLSITISIVTVFINLILYFAALYFLLNIGIIRYMTSPY